MGGFIVETLQHYVQDFHTYYFMQKKKNTLKMTQKIECALAGAHSRVWDGKFTLNAG